MTAIGPNVESSGFERLLAEPTAAALWTLQKTLLAIGDEPAARARAAARVLPLLG